MNTKYEILMDKENSREITIGKGSHERKVIVHRIKALKDIGESVEAGDIGGFVENESNLDIYDDSWVYDSAIVCSDAVIEDSEVREYAFISDHVMITEKSKISGRAVISGNAHISNSVVDDDAHITDFVVVSKDSHVNEGADLRGNVRMVGSVATGVCKLVENVVLHNSHVLEKASLGGSCKIVESTVKDSAYVTGSATVISSVIKDIAEVKDAAIVSNCIIKGDTVLLGRVCLDGNLTIYNSDQIFSITSFDPLYNKTHLGASAKFKGPTFVYTGKKIVVVDGELVCSPEEYIEWAVDTFGEEFREEYVTVCKLARLHFKNCNPVDEETHRIKYRCCNEDKSDKLSNLSSIEAFE